MPFGVETPLSGVRRKVLPEDQIWYRRTFTVHPRKGFRTILNFERVDFRAHVFVTGRRRRTCRTRAATRRSAWT